MDVALNLFKPKSRAPIKPPWLLAFSYGGSVKFGCVDTRDRRATPTIVLWKSEGGSYYTLAHVLIAYFLWNDSCYLF